MEEGCRHSRAVEGAVSSHTVEREGQRRHAAKESGEPWAGWFQEGREGHQGVGVREEGGGWG